MEDTFFGKPISWWAGIRRALEAYEIKDGEHLIRILREHAKEKEDGW